MRLGIFGGTFNPIHVGHLRAAEEVREALGLDRVLFVPAKLPPHKSTRGLADAAFRLRLASLAVADNPGFGVSDVELLREGPSYSIDTLQYFAREHRPSRLWFVMGTDQYAELHTWRRFGEIAALADIAVMRRPPDAEPLAPPRTLESEYSPDGDGFRHLSGRVVRLIEVTGMAISSTAVREALAAGRSVRYLVPENVRILLESNPAQESG